MVGQPVGLGYRRTGSPGVRGDVVYPGRRSLDTKAKSGDVIDRAPARCRCRRRCRCWCGCGRAAPARPDDPEHLVRPAEADAVLQPGPIGAASSVATDAVSPGCSKTVTRDAAYFPLPVIHGNGARG